MSEFDPNKMNDESEAAPNPGQGEEQANQGLPPDFAESAESGGFDDVYLESSEPEPADENPSQTDFEAAPGYRPESQEPADAPHSDSQYPADPPAQYAPPYGQPPQYTGQQMPYGVPLQNQGYGYAPPQPQYGYNAPPQQSPYAPQQPMSPPAPAAPYSPQPVAAPYIPPQPVIDHTAPKVDFSKIEENKAEPVRNNGLRVFSIVLAIVILLSAVATAGYFAGTSRIGTGGSFNAPDLASRPSGEDAGEGTPEYAASVVKPSVVGITVYSELDKSSAANASGVIYTEDGYIITNDHIYADIADPKFLVTLSNGKEYDGVYVAGDTRSDLAVIKIDAKGLTPAVLGNSNELVEGEGVIAVGNPGGLALASTVTKGSVSAVSRRASNASNYTMKFIQTDTPISPGNSGGALANLYGQVVGITSWKYSGDDFDQINFAIPTTTVKTVIDSLIEHDYVVDRCKLGITYTAIDAVTAKLNGTQRGLVIYSITPESDINGKNVAKGDIITHVNDIALTNGDELLDIMEASKPGDKITLTISTASGDTLNIEVKLLEDKGSSSYTKEVKNNASSGSAVTSEFNFPFGE